MKKIKLRFLKLTMATFTGIVRFDGFVRRFIKIPMLYKLDEWAFGIYYCLLDAWARAYGYKNFSEYGQLWLERNAIYNDDPAERDEYDDSED